MGLLRALGRMAGRAAPTVGEQLDLFPRTAPRPVQAYHGTFNDFDEFAPFQHFGTRRAAQQRLNAVRDEGWGAAAPRSASQQGRLIPVEITGRRVNVGDEITFAGGATRPVEVADMLRRARHITDEDYAYATEPLQMGDRYLGRPSQDVVAERLLEITRRNDIGAIGYRNAYEDAGSTSYIVPDPQMIRRLR